LSEAFDKSMEIPTLALPLSIANVIWPTSCDIAILVNEI